MHVCGVIFQKSMIISSMRTVRYGQTAHLQTGERWPSAIDGAVKTATDIHEVLNGYSGKPMTKMICRRLAHSERVNVNFRNTSGQ